MKSKAGDSKEIDITIGVHQGSVLSPLLFITVMEEATKEVRDGTPMELLYADDLVLTTETPDQLIRKFNMSKKGMVVNSSKTKYMVSGETAPKVNRGKFPCAVCSVGVGNNSILCKSCNKWCHKRCSGVRHPLAAIKDNVNVQNAKSNQRHCTLKINAYRWTMPRLGRCITSPTLVMFLNLMTGWKPVCETELEQHGVNVKI